MTASGSLGHIRRHGRKTWKREQGYHLRSLAETVMFRFKRIIGRVLRARKLVNQLAQFAVLTIWHKAAAEQAVPEQVGQPLGILHVRQDCDLFLRRGRAGPVAA